MKRVLASILQLLTAAFICGSSPVAAQSFYSYGIAQESGGPILKNKVISVRGDSVNTTYTFYAVLPENVDARTVRWYTRGGLEIVDWTPTKVTVKSGNGTTYAEKYSKYSNGELQLWVDRTDVASEDCECAQLCDPVAKFYLYFKKSFDIEGNPINGPECANAGDTVTFSVEPWNSLMLYGNDSEYYVWTVEPSDYVLDGSQFYSADHSSTTFTLKKDLASVDGLNLTCKICSVTDDVNVKALSDKPKEPTIYLVDGDTETLVVDNRICLPANATKMVLAISDYNPAFDYSWDVSGWRCSNLGKGVFTFSVAGGDKELKLKLNGGCGSQTFIYNVSRSLSDGLKVAENCFTPGDTVRLMFSGVGQSLDVRWSFADENHNGWEIESGDVTMPTVKVGTAPLKVLVSSAVCKVGESLPFTLYVPPSTPVLVGDYSCLDYAANEDFKMSVKDDAATSSWIWSASNFKFEADESSYKDGLAVVATPTYKSRYSSSIKVTAVGFEGCKDMEVSTSTSVAPTFAKPVLTHTGDCGTPGAESVFSVSSSSSPSPQYYIWDFGGMVDSDGNTGNIKTSKASLALSSLGKEGCSVVTVRPYGRCNDIVASSTTAYDSVCYSHKLELSTEVYYDAFTENYAYNFKIKGGQISASEIKSYSWKIDGVEVSTSKRCSGDLAGYSASDSLHFQFIFTYGEDACVDLFDYYYPLNTVEINSIANKSLKFSGDDAFRIYPNPIECVANIQMVTEADFAVSIYNKAGVLLLHQTGEGSVASLDLSSLKPDVYVCKIEQSGVSSSKILRIKR